jgi:hypothetical protein
MPDHDDSKQAHIQQLQAARGQATITRPKQHWFTMRFQGYLESKFRREYFLKSVKSTRLCSAIVPVALIIGLTAHFTVTGVKPEFTLIAAMGTLIALSVIHIALTLTDRFSHHYDLTLAFGNVIIQV